ncbi:hypothetical protein EAF00_008398 [Botryotinia globosa]|nr:hypothetical protein EAF00_008398 [Botryotinia globosa]
MGCLTLDYGKEKRGRITAPRRPGGEEGNGMFQGDCRVNTGDVAAEWSIAKLQFEGGNHKNKRRFVLTLFCWQQIEVWGLKMNGISYPGC